MKQWQAHHRKICKRFNTYAAGSEYRALQPHQRVDAVLLSQLLVEIFPQDEFNIQAASTRSDPVAQFFDLLKAPVHSQSAVWLPLCRPVKSSEVPGAVVAETLSRFGNNNFLLHSHLTTYAHGIFPLASRLFNHSCAPNCAAKYIITPMEAVRMEVVALRDILAGEEVSVAHAKAPIVR